MNDLTYSDIVEAIKEATRRPEDDLPTNLRMMPIAPFRGADIDGKEFDVVGIVSGASDIGLSFIVLKTDEDGSIFPAWEDAAWPVT